MENDSHGYSLGREVFPNRSEAIKSLTTDVVEEFQNYEARKKVVKRTPVAEDETLLLIDGEIALNLEKCLDLLVSIEKDGSIRLDESSRVLLNNFFVESGRTPVVLSDQQTDSTLEKTHTLLVIARSNRELEGIVKEFIPIKTNVNLKQAASLLRKPDGTSGFSLIQKVLSFYAKLPQIPGFKEWESQNGRNKNSTHLQKLESLAKPQITDIFKIRRYDLYSSFSNAIHNIALDLNDYSMSLIKAAIPKS